MKKLLSIILASVMMLSLTACSNETAETTTSEETLEKGLKIISLDPTSTEILTDLGIKEELVAVDMYVGAGYEELPAFDAFNPEIETMLALSPDIVFVSGMSDISGTDLYSSLTDANSEIEIINIPVANSINEIYENINLIALKVNKVSEGEELINNMEIEIETITEIVKTAEGEKSVYFEVSNLYSLGANTYINEMIEILGAKNIFADEESWIAVNEEELIARNPDIILTSDGYTPDVVNTILNNENYKDITAVKNGDVYLIDPNSSARANHRITLALKEMARAIYGEEIISE